MTIQMMKNEESNHSHPSNFQEQLTPGIILANSIYFSNQPKNQEFLLPPLKQSKRGVNLFILNYSDLYQELEENVPEKIHYFLKPSDILTGDALQAGSYRGCGSYYAIWLAKGLYQNNFLIDYEALESNPFFQGVNDTSKEDSDRIVDLEKYQLDDNLLTQLQSICRMKPAERITELSKLLSENSPQLLEDLTKGKSRRFLLEAIQSHRFQGDGNSLKSNPGPCRWTDLSLTDCFEEYFEKTPDAKYLLSSFPLLKYPVLKSRSELCDFYCPSRDKGQRFDLYLFRHTDENGYTIPTVMSMAPINYFSCSAQSRDVDLTLLPSPLSEETAVGLALFGIKQRIVMLLEHEEEEENQKSEDQPKKKKQKTQQKGKYPSATRFAENDIAVIDFQVHDAINWATIVTADQMMVVDEVDESPLITTRKIFEKHVKTMKSLLCQLHTPDSSTLTEIELLNLFMNLP